MKEQVELQIIIDEEGIKCVRILGSSEKHAKGHEMYFKLQHLFPELDQKIKKTLSEREEDGQH